jgi:transcription elongation GreA/GreB family factor
MFSKAALVDHLNTLLNAKVHALEREVAHTLEARNSDTKSSAGDKHEVGRAMVQQELDQLEAQLAKTHVLKAELARVPLDRAFDRAGFGSVVRTGSGTYFMAIGLGRVEVNGAAVFVVSLASPIGQAMNGKHAGETVDFNGKRITILSIA